MQRQQNLNRSIENKPFISLKMEFIPNIYATVPYLERVQISKFDMFRYFFRPIANTK